MDPDKDMEIFW